MKKKIKNEEKDGKKFKKKRKKNQKKIKKERRGGQKKKMKIKKNEKKQMNKKNMIRFVSKFLRPYDANR